MQPKKHPKADLEKKGAIRVQIGLVTVLALVLVSLEWATPEDTTDRMSERTEIQPFDPNLIVHVPREEQQKKKEPEVLIPVPVDDDIDVESIDPGRFTTAENPTGIPEGWLIDDIDDGPEEVKPYEPVNVQVMAEFPGGEEAMMKWIYSNIRYPEICVQNGVTGRVTAKFVITKFGEVKDIEILQSPHPDLGAEVIRVLKMMPKFRPAMQNQQLVPVYMYWPVVFRLE
ncbi:MAG: energy transducer TonB [Bacteroidales bacterium]|nr:energy transducer TonB [Bacteroidales bacterium]MDT8431747.1 energy transducer TonB [Bacteroidales bacterium]